MLLYHGTTLKVANAAVVEGLKPRGFKPSMWDQQSCSEAVYLTDAYAPYFSFNACATQEVDEAAVLAIDTNMLGPELFVADEDALEQATRGKDNLPVDWDMSRRTTFYANMHKDMALRGLDYKWSLSVLGTCCYLGTIPSTAITKVGYWELSKNSNFHWIFDPTITLANYRFCGGRYRRIMKLFMKDKIEEELNQFDVMSWDFLGMQKAFQTIHFIYPQSSMDNQ